MRAIGYIFTVAVILSSSTLAGAQNISRQRLENNINFLENGRKAGSPEGEAAAEHIAGMFEQAGIKPFFAGQYIDEFTAEPLVGSARKTYRNVAGIIHGNSLELDGDYIVVGAHYDYAGEGGSSNTVIEDNLSGIAALMELAYAVKECGPGRNVVFVAFDGYEQGLLGSRRFTQESTLPVENMLLMMDLGPIGCMPKGGLLYLYTDNVLPRELRHLVAGNGGFEVSVVESGYNGRSDTEPFISAEVSSVYITTNVPEPQTVQAIKSRPVDLGTLEEITGFLAGALCDISRDAAINRDQVKMKKKERGPLLEGGVTVLSGTSFHRPTDGDMRGKTLFSGGAGLYGQLNLGGYFGLRPEVQYIHSGSRYGDGKRRMNSVVVPFSIVFQTPSVLPVNIHVSAGGYYRRTFSGTEILIEDSDYSERLYSNGAGVQWGINLKLNKFSVGVVTRYGLTNLYYGDGINLRERATYGTLSYNF